jgi:hypothetical protein
MVSRAVIKLEVLPKKYIYLMLLLNVILFSYSLGFYVFEKDIRVNSIVKKTDLDFRAEVKFKASTEYPFFDFQTPRLNYMNVFLGVRAYLSTWKNNTITTAIPLTYKFIDDAGVIAYRGNLELTSVSHLDANQISFSVRIVF